MAQFDVLRIRGGVYALDCQAGILDDLPTRFVVPLRPDTAVKPTKLTPEIRFDDQILVMVTPLARGVAVRDIEAVVANVADQEWIIKGALDMLISGF